MVFERIVVDVLNRYLGDFIENLDSKQLSIGVWGGELINFNIWLYYKLTLNSHRGCGPYKSDIEAICIR